MATRKPKAPPREPTHEEKMVEAERAFLDDFDRTQEEIQPAPTRMFENGELVRVGNLQNVVVLKKLFDGKAYVYRCDWQGKRDDPVTVHYRCSWWFDLEKMVDTSARPQLMSGYKQYPAISSDISAILHHMQGGGLVCDPMYQRGYVWSEENKDALIESIFERLDIGAFLLVTHSGFNHEGDESLKEYRTMDGRIVHIKRCEDYTSAVVDGQQRLTTILDFYLNRRPYKGLYFSQLCWQDRHEFEQHSVQYRLVREEQVKEKDVVRMFLQSNRGVPQSAEHLAKVQALYDSMA